MFLERSPVSTHRRQGELDKYLFGLHQALEREAVADDMGSAAVARLSNLADRVILASLTSYGAVEMPEEASPDAIAVLPVLPREHSGRWHLGASLSEELSPQTLETVQDHELEPSCSEASQEYCAYREAEGPISLAREGVGAHYVFEQHAFTDGGEDFRVASRGVVILYPRPGATTISRGALLGHELTHIGNAEGGILPATQTVAVLEAMCHDEGDAHRAEGSLTEGVSRGALAHDGLHIVHLRRKRNRIAILQQEAIENRDPRPLITHMLANGYVRPHPLFMEELSEEDKDYLGRAR